MHLSSEKEIKWAIMNLVHEMIKHITDNENMCTYNYQCDHCGKCFCDAAVVLVFGIELN